MNITTQGNVESGYQTNISMVSGETISLPITLSSGGNPINLTGYSVKAQVNFPTPLVLNTTDGGITITDAAQGAIELAIASADTAAIEQGNFAYDLWMTSPSNDETPLLTGQVIISANVTQVP